MSNDSEQLAQIVDWIQRTDREIIDDIDDTTEEGVPVSGFRVSHGTDELLIYTIEGIGFFFIQFEFSIIPSVAAKIAITEKAATQDGGDEVEIQVTPEHHQQAQQRIAQKNATREEGLQKLHYKLVQQLAHPDAGYRIRDDLNGPHGFEIKRKLFVDDSTISEFNRACQTVISLGIVPRETIAKAYNADIQIEDQSDQTSQSVPNTRGFY